MDTEEWVDLKKFPNHQVSSYGRVRNKRTGYILKPFSDRYGYLRLSIGNTDNVYIHQLVCEAFYGEPSNKSMQVNYIDANRQNNHVLNLEYCTGKENVRWGVFKGNLKPEIGLNRAIEVNRRPVRIVELDRVFPSVKDCAYFLGVSLGNVCRCLRGNRMGQRLHGYHVEYADQGGMSL